MMRDFALWLCDASITAIDITEANCLPPRVPSDIEGAWLWNFLQRKENDVPLLIFAQKIADLPNTEKRKLATWIQNVAKVSLHFQPNPPATFPAPLISEISAWPSFKKLMLAFYSKGFYQVGLPYLPDGTATDKTENWITYRKFVEEFRQKHKSGPEPDSREVCVLCGGVLGKPHIDHWISEAKYPLLSVFSENLLPICQDCNESPNKGAKDVHSNGSFKDWFHPYWRHANGGIQLDYELQIFSIVCSATNPADSAKVSNLDKLLNLTDRWTREFKAEFRKQQSILIERERHRLSRGQPRHTQNEILAHLLSVQEDLLSTEPNYEVHSVLCSAMLEQSRLAAWQTELGLVS